MSLICRALKRLPVDYPQWGKIRKLTLCRALAWLDIPSGKQSSAHNNRQFKFFKMYVGFSKNDVIKRLSKLLVFFLGREDDGSLTPTTLPPTLSTGTTSLVAFMNFIAPYFNPSNIGNWTGNLTSMMHYMCCYLSQRIGFEQASTHLNNNNNNNNNKTISFPQYNVTLLPHEISAVVDCFLPLTHQMIYSKGPQVSYTGAISLRNLAAFSQKVTSPSLTFFLDALDEKAINQTHQAPSALNSIHLTLHQFLRPDPTTFLGQLPSFLALSLSGVDSNDEGKTASTLVAYMSIFQWLPIGGTVNQRLALENGEQYKTAADNAFAASSDFVLLFLDKMYVLLKNQGEAEKAGRNQASMYSAQATKVSDRSGRDEPCDRRSAKRLTHSNRLRSEQQITGLITVTIRVMLSACDEETFSTALKSIASFVSENVVVFASKRVAGLLEACSYRNATSSLHTFVPILTSDLKTRSMLSVRFYTRALSGLVRITGSDILPHKDAVVAMIQFSLDSDDKLTRKAACKVLRHLFISLISCSPTNTNNNAQLHQRKIGEPLSALPDAVPHVPNKLEMSFVFDLFQRFLIKSLTTVERILNLEWTDDNESNKVLDDWRLCSKIIHYCLRGCIGFLPEGE